MTEVAPRTRHLLILGSTGSIGRQALEVLPAVPDLHLVGLAAGRGAAGVVEQARAHGVRAVCLHDADAAAQAAALAPELVVHAGEAGIGELIAGAAERAAAAGAPLVVLNGVVGAAGLRATVATLEAGATLALANKESMVAGGPFVLDLARRRGALILPVDSEHSALFQCISVGAPAGGAGGAGRVPGSGGAAGAGTGSGGVPGTGSGAGSGGEASADVVSAGPQRALEELLLTGSGGPFRGRSAADLASITPDDALAHPNWSMGPKITIDSATLMNKGLELIEAHYLFGVPYERITVVLDPKSTVHSMARFTDGAILAHLGVPDMRTPIGWSLAYPERPELPQVRRLDLFSTAIAFAAPDTETFRCLALAREWGTRAMLAEREAVQAGTGPRTIAGPIVLNAANEVAVAAFLDRRLSFLGIAEIVEATLDRLGDAVIASLDDVYACDAQAREVAAHAAAARA